MTLSNRKPRQLYSVTKTINFNDANYSTTPGILIASLPLGARPLRIEVDVFTAFDISSDNRPWIGFSFNTNDWITTSEMTLDIATLGQVYRNFLTAGVITAIPLADGRNVVFTGYGSPTAGKADIRIIWEY